jgi:hypothetical protein
MTKAAELAKWGEVSTNGQVSGRRNIITNGAMNVAQRSASVTGLGASSNYFTLDRWKTTFAASAGRLTMTQTSDGPSGFANCIKLDCTTADTSIAAGELLIMQHNLEGQDVQAIGKGVTGAKEVTLSFYVKANAAFDFVAELQDQDNSRTNGRVFSTTTDWVRHELTFQADVDDGSSPFDDDNAKSLAINFWLHAGATYTGGTLASSWENSTSANRAAGIDSFYSSTDNNFFITGVQLEVGSVATPFEHRSFGEELALCQRYFQVIGGDTTNDVFASGFTGANSFYGIGKLNGRMRLSPTASLSGTNSHINYTHVGVSASANASPTFSTNPLSFYFTIASGTSTTSNAGSYIRSLNTSTKLHFDSEL